MHKNPSHKLPKIDTPRELPYLPTYNELGFLTLRRDITIGTLQSLNFSSSNSLQKIIYMAHKRHLETIKHISSSKVKWLKLQLNPSNLYEIMRKGSPICLQYIPNHYIITPPKYKLKTPTSACKAINPIASSILFLCCMPSKGLYKIGYTASKQYITLLT